MNNTVGKSVLSLGGLCMALASQAAPVYSSVAADPGTGAPFTAEQFSASMAASAAATLEGNLVTNSIKRQNLESLTANSTPGVGGIALTFAASNGASSAATLTGGGKVDNKPYAQSENGDDGEFLGRFNTTQEASAAKFFESNQTFTITFTDGTTFDAFGFFGTDFGDFNGTFTLELLLNGAVMTYKQFPTPTATAPGSTLPDDESSNGTLQFIGFYDTEQRYNGVRFSIGQGAVSDYLGFDDFFIGDYNRTSNEAPEPGSLALVGLSLLGLAASRRRRAA